jgi:hypothetical protein
MGLPEKSLMLDKRASAIFQVYSAKASFGSFENERLQQASLGFGV